MIQFIISILIPLAVGRFAGFLTENSFTVYENLVQPAFAPAPWVFPIVWTILYVLMGIASYKIYQSNVAKEDKKRALTFYAVQLVVNFIWPIVFFRFGNYQAAFFVLLVLIALVILTILQFSKINKTAAWIMIPYLLWIVFAGILNFSIWMLN